MVFKNESRPKEKDNFEKEGQYGYDKPSKCLVEWGRLFQNVISQAGTYLLTKKFHDRHCAIYKAEGGCHIYGVGDLVLGKRICYFDCYQGCNKKATKIAELITHIVLNWDPMDPIDSMLKLASDFIKVEPAQLRTAVEASNCGRMFDGNALANFFDWNPFGDLPIDRDYERYCLVKFSGKTDAVVDQKYADEDLGRELREKINAKIAEVNSNGYTRALCCSARRNKENEKLNFWINTGRQTQIDGWKSREAIEEFLKSDGILTDTTKY